jgi:hypothetical protein
MKNGFTEKVSLILVALFFIAAIASGSAGNAMAAEDSVTSVKDKSIVFYTKQGNFWYGEKLRVGFKTPDGEMVPVGYWSVDRVKYEADRKTKRMTAWQVEAQSPADVGYQIEFIKLKNRERIEWLKRAADAGCSGAAYGLADAFYIGEGVERDIDRAVDLMRRAAQMGHPEAQFDMYHLLDRQWGKNNPDRVTGRPAGLEKERRMWLERAAENGQPQAQRMLGLRYLTLYKDMKKAEYWYRRAADVRPPFGKNWEPLTEMAGYLSALGYKEKALAIYRESARKGGEKAQAELQKRGISW